MNGTAGGSFLALMVWFHAHTDSVRSDKRTSKAESDNKTFERSHHSNFFFLCTRMFSFTNISYNASSRLKMALC